MILELRFYLPDDSALKFFDLVDYQLHAKLVDSVNFASLKDADFDFDSNLQQRVLEIIREQILEQFNGASEAAATGIEAAKKKVAEAKRLMEAAIEKAKQDVEYAHEAYKVFSDSVHKANDGIVRDFEAEVRQLQEIIDNARNDYNAAMDVARKAVDQANTDRGAAMAAAERDVVEAKRDMSSGIDTAQRHLDYVEADLDKAFGDANRAIDNARRDVQRIQNDINSNWRTIRAYQNAPWYDFPKKAAIPGLWIINAALETAKAVADSVLAAAGAVLEGPRFLVKEAAVTSARAALEAARHTAHAGLDSANAALRLADKTSQAAVDIANETVKGVQTGGQFIALQAAIGGLEAFKDASSAAYKAAVQAIKNLIDSIQYATYQSALRALELAKGATGALDLANLTLEAVKRASQLALELAGEIVNHGLRALAIQNIHISGRLRGISGGSSLRAVIQGYILGTRFDVELEFNPLQFTEFIENIFKG